jgi:hypothetical protein
MTANVDKASVRLVVDSPKTWSLHFEFGCCGSTSRFAMYDAAAYSREEWAALAAGKGHIGRIRADGGALEFGITRDDAEIAITIPLAVVAEPLRAAIQAAVAEGLPFAPPAPTVRA